MRRFAALALCLAAGPAFAGPAVYGFTFPAWWRDAYQFPGADASLEALARSGAKWVALVPTWYVRDRRHSEIRPTDQTPSDESLVSILRRAKALGLKVALKPHVDSEEGGPRALLKAEDPAAWFRSYRAFLRRYARLARAEGVDLFVVGTELFLMARPAFRPEWERAIREVRSTYDGPLTYAANWYDFQEIPFWGLLDYVGVDAYFPLPGGDAASMGRSWRLLYKPLLLGTAARHGKPLLFTEIGLASQRGANLRPWEWREFGPVDLEIQRAYFEAFLGEFEGEPSFGGFLQWAWHLGADAGGPGDKSMTVQGKPALDLLKAAFRRWNLSTPVAARVLAVERAQSPALQTLGSFPGPGF